MSLTRSTRCDGIHRRDVLRLGGLTALGLGLSDWFRLRAVAAEKPRVRAKSCILLWLDGGPSHLETFDLKPDVPADVRGPFQPIKTKTPGIEICELLPRTAEVTKHLAIIRSMTSPLGEHGIANHYLLTGYKPSPVLDYPSYGAVIANVRGGTDVLPPNVAVPEFRSTAGAGFLGSAYQPFATGGDPAKPDFRVHNLDAFPGITSERLHRRREFLSEFDRAQAGVDSTAPADAMFEQAYRLVTSQNAKKAFDLSEEKDATRARYGPRTIGQSCLLARRLVECGVPFVSVLNTGWDTHDSLVLRLKEGYTGAKVGVGLVPTFDLAFSALVSDLADRGLLDETLVVAMGEFGRTPKLNVRAGRDHWPRVFSVAMAGGGVKGGQVIGSSDRVGESPREDPVTPADLAYTIYTLLGIDPKHELHTSDGRPVQVNQGGSVINKLVEGVDSRALSVVFIALFCGSTARGAPPITTAAFTPDGKQVVLGSQEGVAVFSWPELKLASRVKVELSHVHDLAFSPDGKTLLAAGGAPAEEGAIEVLSWPDGKRIRRIADYKDLVYRVAWSPDGMRWAAASADGTCRVYASDTGKQLTRYEGHSRPVLAIIFLPDGKTVVSAGVDQTLQVWETATGKLLRTLDNHLKPVNDLAVRPKTDAETPMIASVSDDRTVRLWQPTTGRLVRFTRLESAPRAVVWSPDGLHLLVGCDDGQLRVLDPDTLEITTKKKCLDARIHTLISGPKEKRQVFVGGVGVHAIDW